MAVKGAMGHRGPVFAALLAGTFAIAYTVSEGNPSHVLGLEPGASQSSSFIPPVSHQSLKADGKTVWRTIPPLGITLHSELGQERGQRLYSLTVHCPEPLSLGDGKIELTAEGEKRLFRKVLHSADPDLYIVFRCGTPQFRLILKTYGLTGPVRYKMRLARLTEDPAEVIIEAEPNDTPQDAQQIRLGAPVIGSGDDRSYMIPPDGDEVEFLSGGADWFRVEQPDEEPRLVFFNLDILDRDVPANITVYTMRDGQLEPYVEGYDPVSGPHEAQVGPVVRQAGVELNSANKFTTRVLKRGTYYLKVEANHPAYRLRTSVYPVPPYDKPDQAITVALNYLVAAGDSWFANTPRSGAVPRRDRQVHLETVVCTACHPSQFSTRGALWAYQNGYPIFEREALRFLAERLRNAPRPFYLDGTVWVRFIGASAHVLSQKALIQDLYESVAQERLPDYFTANAGYVRAFYKRDRLPPSGTGNDEQNPPTLSTFETAWMALRLFRKIGDRETYEKVQRLVVVAPDDLVQTVDDLAWRIVCFSEIDRERLSTRIGEDVRQLLGLQRADGSWSYRKDEKSPSSEFSTGTALFALARAGLTPEDPRVAQGVRFLLSRQKPFGGWNTDGQPFEAFNTPFKETQLAVMALSELYPRSRHNGWGSGGRSAGIRRSSHSATLRDLHSIWDWPNQNTVDEIRRLTRHPEPLVRWEAVNALCRLADEKGVTYVGNCLNDETLMVRRSAAQGLREIYSRRPGTDGAERALAIICQSLDDPKTPVRRAALRAVHQHFRWLASDNELLRRVISIARADPDPVSRLQAIQALPQFWVWNPSAAARSRILTAILDGLAEPQVPQTVLASLKESLYSILDEDIQYVYAFWVPLLPDEQDRKAALANFERVMTLQATKIADALTKGSPILKKRLLEGLAEFPIVRSWNPDDQIERNFYRIGNDLDAIDYRGKAADILEPVIASLMSDPDRFVRQRALVFASYLRSSGARPLLANKIVSLLLDRDPTVRRLASQSHRLFPFNDRHVQYGIDPRRYPDQPNYDDSTKDLLLTLLEAAEEPVAPLLLPVLSEQPTWFDGLERVGARVISLIERGAPATRAAAFDFLRFLPSLHADAQIRRLVAQALDDDDVEPAVSAAHLALTSSAIGHSEEVSQALDRLLQTDDPAIAARLLSLAQSDSSIRDDVRWVPLLEKCLTGGGDIKSRAVTLIRQSKSHRSNPSVRLILASLARTDDGPDGALIQQILEGQTGQSADPEKRLDFEYFSVRIQPLLAAPAGDGRSCFSCHANQSVLNLKPPDPTGYFPNEVSRHNYRSVLRVVNLDQPEESLILKKPMMEVPHCGGKRWFSRDHPAYQAILLWLNGAKVKQGEALGKLPE